MIKIAPSLLAADFTSLKSEVVSLNNTEASMLHLDVMDGHFVPNISFGPSVIKQIRPYSELFFDVHLMISDPMKYIDEFVATGADSITFHFEAVEEPEKVIDYIRSKNVMVALSIKPKTPVSAIAKYLDMIDMLLIMSVEPGFGGQKFMPESLDKVKEAKKIISERGLETLVQIDGGVNASTVKSVADAGCDIAVAGTAVFGKEDREKAINDLIEISEG